MRHIAALRLPHSLSSAKHWFARCFRACIFLTIASTAQANTVSLQWDPVLNDSRIAGYEVAYGPTGAAYDTSLDASENGAATDSIVVAGLTAGTYDFAVRSRNTDGSQISGYSNIVTVTVEGDTGTTPPDTTPPNVSLAATPSLTEYTSPQTVTLAAVPSDDTGISQVEFFDGSARIAVDTTAPYEYAWPIVSSDNGTHTWTAKAYDIAGNVGTSAPVSLNVAIQDDTAGSLPAGLVAAYSFDETQDTLVRDISGNANDGVLIGATRTSTGKHGNALSFDGIDDSVDLKGLDIPDANGLTLSLWMNADDFDTYDARLLSKATGYQDQEHFWMLSTFSSKSVRFRLKADGSTSTLISKDGVLQTGRWHHVAATYDGQQMRIYVDGQQVASQSKTGIVDANSTVPASLGNQPQGSRAFDGLIDDVRIYRRALSTTEIQTDLQTALNESPTPDAPPVAAFKIGSATGIAPHTTSFTDTSAGQINSWSWEFGDGAGSTDQSPTHTYLEPGVYSVKLTVVGTGGSATTTATVSVAEAPPSASFSADKTSGEAPLTVLFTDTSSGTIDSWYWDFGDGSTSTAASAAYTYTIPGTYSVSLTVAGPGGESTVTENNLVTVDQPLVADFQVDAASGRAPLTVNFTDASSGAIKSYAWDFGDGSTSSQANPSHVYASPGTYDVTLVVSAQDGTTDSITKQDHIRVDDGVFTVAVESGEILVDHNWKYVQLHQDFSDPVVIVSPLSGNGGDPAVVRIDGADSSGFWIRVQQWDYLDDGHTTEIVHYLVVERGRHQLPTGSWIEAGVVDVELDSSAGVEFVPIWFEEPFSAQPVVLSTVASSYGTDAVATRMREISSSGFELRLQEQESSEQQHVFETVAYLAWEPSSGEWNGIKYEVGTTADEVTHQGTDIAYLGTFDAPPLFFADMQSTDGADTANLRWRNKSAASIEVWVDEEQSRDNETRHTTETVGYILIDSTPSSTLLHETFDSYDSGTSPLDWTSTMPNNSMVEDPDLFTAVEVGSERVFGTASTETNIHSHYTGAALSDIGGYEYRGRMLITHPDSGVGVTLFSQYPYEDVYYRLRRYAGYPSFHLAPHLPGSSLSGEIDTGVVPTANVWYEFRVRVEDSGGQTEIRAKVWSESQSEPLAWQVHAIDGTQDRLIDGTVGIWSMGQGSKYWDEVMIEGLQSSSAE